MIILLALLSGGAFTVSLDDTIVATAIPRITDDFHSISDVAWYGSGYLITMGGLQLLFGKLYKLHVDRTIYTVSLCIFATGSTISATAPNSFALICGRALAGTGAAGIVSGGIVILGHTVPLRLLPVYISITSGLTVVGTVAGPLFGGLLTDGLSWRWSFYINLPIVGTVLTLFVLLYRPKHGKSSQHASSRSCKERAAMYDPLGNALFFSAVICCQIALEWADSHYPWRSARVIALFVCSAVFLTMFVPLQVFMRENATIPGHIAKRRAIASSGVFMAFLCAAYFSVVYYLPLWFQGVKGSSPTHSAIMSIALLVTMVLSSLIAAGLMSKTGWYNPFALAAPVLASCGAGLLSTLEPNSGPGKYIGFQVLLGAGVGCAFHIPFVVVNATLQESDRPTGIGLMMCAELLGGALGVSVAQKIFESRLVAFVGRLAPDVERSTILKTGATELTSLVPEDQVAAVPKAYSDAVTSTFYLSSACAAASIIAASFMEWRNIKKSPDNETRNEGTELHTVPTSGERDVVGLHHGGRKQWSSP
ncbi:putative major facilitator superfamily transporter [Zymoseptoria tritici IPO323]|uniref:Major facilitator superfamily transporter n=1 Tax=Zymoseptoria tritici (strain CBS 115943 / IPO323) TaxID=336722 RepID=F9X1H2_ZYMTI|nr:putative major facilitator superfamily transporter [Zymoseptoria tritici IPO323]EGP91887.1 putative major facilitator superfamily transporter [Zymoseptoria tritici IPO323]